MGRRGDDDEMEWSQYSPEEAREGIKRLNAKKGPRFDFLASPTNTDTSTTTTNTAGQRSKRKAMAPATSGFPWVPPPRTSGTPMSCIQTPSK